MNDRLDGSPIEYSVYVPSQAEEMTRLLADAFAHHEGLSVAAGLSEAQFAMFVRTFLPQVAEEKLTIVARFADSGEMVGALLTNDPARETAPPSETLHEKFGPVAGILGQLVATYKAGREPRPGEMLHLYLLGVLRSSRRPRYRATARFRLRRERRAERIPGRVRRGRRQGIAAHFSQTGVCRMCVYLLPRLRLQWA